jgi:prepilin-type N-terminal cleavage/methylation domain-containing protein
MTAKRSQRGFSLPEVLVTITVVSGLAIIAYAMLDQASRVALFNESHNDLTIMTQRAVNGMQNEVFQARRAFEEDATGQAYRAALQLPASQPVWTDTLLPIIETDTASILPDTGTDTSRSTGNSLFIARQLEPLTINYDDDNNAATPDVQMLVDRYRFEYYFLSPVASRGFAANGFMLDLIRSASGDYADYFELSTLTPAVRRLVIPQIINKGIAQAWDTTQAADQAFYDLDAARSGTFSIPIAKPKIGIVSTATIFPGLRGGRIAGKMDYSVAFIPQSPLKPFPLRFPVFNYAQADTNRKGFPAGFEVKIVGPAKNRKVLIRTVLMAHYRSTFESEQGVVTTAARF